LVMIGGGETFVEDNFFYIAHAAHERGYNFITIDLPGQGMMPADGYFFRPDTEAPMKVVLDYVLERPEVDSEKLAVYGISNGGYFVPRAAQYDDRIKAVVVSSAVVDNYRMFEQMPFARQTQEEIVNWPDFKRCVTSAVTWRWGLDSSDIKGQVAKNVGYQFDPAKITCPFLDLVGEGEHVNEETRRQQKECMEKLPTKNKKLIITPANEGASSHCIGENRSLMSQLVFDWLDETFEDN
ncbi:MAG: alpha/beta hydrolase family protein, partial [Vulcanimicrobiota bacterium]